MELDPAAIDAKLAEDRSKVISLVRRGAKLCADDSSLKEFQELGMQPTHEAVEAIDRAGVVIDCTRMGLEPPTSRMNWRSVACRAASGIMFRNPMWSSRMS